MHLKDDSLGSLLGNYWNWNVEFYQKEGWYANKNIFINKIKENLGLANKYLEEDIAAGRKKLIYLDFLLALQYSLADLRYFFSQENQENDLSKDKLPLRVWLSLVDLDFFIHFDFNKKNISTLIKNKDMFLQNFIALNLTLGSLFRNTFKDESFQKSLIRHLFSSVFKMEDEILFDKILLLSKLHNDWKDLYDKSQPNINSLFLREYSECFSNWILNLKRLHPNIVEVIKNSVVYLN